MWNSSPGNRQGRRQPASSLAWVTLAICTACAVYDESLLSPKRGGGSGAHAGTVASGGKGGGAGGTETDGGGGVDAGTGGMSKSGAGGMAAGDGGVAGSGGPPSGGGGGRAGAANEPTGGVAPGGASTGGVSGGSPTGGKGGTVAAGGAGPAGAAGEAGAAGAGGSESCSDGAVNGSETGKDCGGDCPACTTGERCAIDADCQSTHCIANVCSVVNCTDKIRNGRETDIDCGGADCPDCAPTQMCSAHNDCVTGVCTSLRCAAQRTCAEVKALVATAPDGLYTIDPDGTGTGAAFPAYCDMTSASGGWTRVGYEPAGAGGSQVNGALNRLGVSVGTPAGVAGKTAAGLIGARFSGLYTELRITWAANYAQMTVSSGIFVDTLQPAIPVSKVTSNNTTLTGWLSSGAVFCRAASSTYRPGDTSWALVPSSNPDTTCGCNGMGWSGNGIYYGGSNPADACTAWAGAFAGVRAVGEQKGGVTSATELLLWVR